MLLTKVFCLSRKSVQPCQMKWNRKIISAFQVFSSANLETKVFEMIVYSNKFWWLRNSSWNSGSIATCLTFDSSLIASSYSWIEPTGLPLPNQLLVLWAVSPLLDRTFKSPYRADRKEATPYHLIHWSLRLWAWITKPTMAASSQVGWTRKVTFAVCILSQNASHGKTQKAKHRYTSGYQVIFGLSFTERFNWIFGKWTVEKMVSE